MGDTLKIYENQTPLSSRVEYQKDKHRVADDEAATSCIAAAVDDNVSARLLLLLSVLLMLSGSCLARRARNRCVCLCPQHATSTYVCMCVLSDRQRAHSRNDVKANARYIGG